MPTNQLVLAVQRGKGHFTMDTDACNAQLGYVPLQKQQEGTTRPIRYWSRTLEEPKTKLAKIQKICLAVVWTILLLHVYLEGSRFTVRTDHEALKWFLTLTNETEKLTRCPLCLLAFDFIIVHCASINNQAADALSLPKATEVAHKHWKMRYQ